MSVKQGRNEGGQRGNNSLAAEWLRRARKSPNNVTSTFFNTVHLLPKDLRFEHVGVKPASWPGRHLTSVRPWCERYNGFLGHLDPRLPHLVTSVKSLHGFDLRCNKDYVHESKARLISLKFLIAKLISLNKTD